MTAGIVAFCLIFAVNSSVHSYLVVRYSEGNKVAMNVGFYYMSNAAGRLTGTIMSGALYSYAGGVFEYLLGADEPCGGTTVSGPDGALVCSVPDVTAGFGWCFVASCCFIVFSTVLMFPVKDDEGGMRCGSLSCCGATDEEGVKEKDPEAPKEEAKAAAETTPPEVVSLEGRTA